MRRLILQSDLNTGDRIYITDKDDIAYLSVILRMKEGDALLVLNGSGKAWRTEIAVIDRNGIELDVLSEERVSEDAGVRVTIYQGLPKGAKMEDMVRKATELGAYRVVPVRTARTIPGAEGVPSSKIERWRRIAKEASKQARRLLVPEVTDVLTFEDVLKELKSETYDLILALFELEEKRTLKQALRDQSGSFLKEGKKLRSIAVFIGPEGGFEQGEIEKITREGGESVTIGNTILRTETAGPAAVAMILYELELS